MARLFDYAVFARLFLALLVALAGGFAFGTPARAEGEVDLTLVLAVDVSRSMDYDELAIQRQGYAEAFRSAEVIGAILSGRHARIAVSYVEWAGSGIARVIVPWTLIDGEAAARGFAGELSRQLPQRLSRTSISGALSFSAELLDRSPWRGMRQVVDVSGDGPNNQGAPVESERDRLVEAGISINGLPLMVRTSGFGLGIDNLDDYYSDCVIGGAASFVLPVYGWEEFPMAVRRKLVLEIAGLVPSRDQPPKGRPVAIEAAFSTPVRDGVDCMIGEKLWELRMRDMEWR